MTFGEGIFLAVGNDGRILTSVNSANWASRSIGITYNGGNLRSATFHNRIWIVVANDSIVLTSETTINWTRRGARTLENLHGIQPFKNAFTGLVQPRGIVAGSAAIHPLLFSDIIFDDSLR